MFQFKLPMQSGIGQNRFKRLRVGARITVEPVEYDIPDLQEWEGRLWL